MPQEQSGGQAASICTLLAHTVAALAATEAQSLVFRNLEAAFKCFHMARRRGQGFGGSFTKMAHHHNLYSQHQEPGQDTPHLCTILVWVKVNDTTHFLLKSDVLAAVAFIEYI